MKNNLIELIKCPCKLRDYMNEDDCRKTLCCECCPLQTEPPKEKQNE